METHGPINVMTQQPRNAMDTAMKARENAKNVLILPPQRDTS